jgi:hypothetical protein
MDPPHCKEAETASYLRRKLNHFGFWQQQSSEI